MITEEEHYRNALIIRNANKGTDLSWAPWSEKQVEAINNYHDSNLMPLTCPINHVPGNQRERYLVAKSHAMVCRHCDYRQYWVYPAIAAYDVNKYRRADQK